MDRQFRGTYWPAKQLKAAVSQGTYTKAPGKYGICLEFLKVSCEIIKI